MAVVKPEGSNRSPGFEISRVGPELSLAVGTTAIASDLLIQNNPLRQLNFSRLQTYF